MPVKQLGRVEIDPPYLFLEEKLLAFNTVVLGYSSKLEKEYEGHKNWHVGMFDSVPLSNEKVRRVRTILEDQWMTLDFYLFLSTKGKDTYHIVSPCYMSVFTIHRITQSLFPYLDQKFYGLGLTRGFWDLRITTKARKETKIQYQPPPISAFPQRKTFDQMTRLSGAHLKILEMLGVPVTDFPYRWLDRADGETEVELYRYSI